MQKGLSQQGVIVLASPDNRFQLSIRNMRQPFITGNYWEKSSAKSIRGNDIACLWVLPQWVIPPPDVSTFGRVGNLPIIYRSPAPPVREQ